MEKNQRIWEKLEGKPLRPDLKPNFFPIILVFSGYRQHYKRIVYR